MINKELLVVNNNRSLSTTVKQGNISIKTVYTTYLIYIDKQDTYKFLMPMAGVETEYHTKYSSIPIVLIDN